MQAMVLSEAGRVCRMSLCDDALVIELAYPRPWRCRIRWLRRLPAKRSFMDKILRRAEPEPAYTVEAAASLQSLDPSPFAWARTALAEILATCDDAVSTQALIEHVVRTLETRAEAAQIHVTKYDDDNILAPHIVDALSGLSNENSEALGWYRHHYKLRAEQAPSRPVPAPQQCRLPRRNLHV